MADTRTERRSHDRTAVSLAATIERVGGRPLTGTGSTIDLSQGGARFVGPAGFSVGDVVRVRIDRGDVSVERQALVVGREAQSAKTAALNLAFKVLDGHDPADIEQILASERG